jgi:glycosyltransferase involved in cell wall biosynthesis
MLEPWAWRHKRWKKLPYFHLIEKRWIRHAAAALATAQPEADRLRAFFPQTPVESLPLGMTGDATPDYLAARAQHGWATDELVLLFLSRLHVKKGVEMLLEALAGLDGTVPPRTRLVIVGEGEPAYVAALHEQAARLAGRLPRVEWTGAVWGEARWTYFQGADLFCLPTFSENFGLAVLESCQVGTPVLTTTGTPWATELTAERGYISEPTVDSIRAALARFFAAPRAVDRTALAAWARTHYHWDALAARYEALYQNLRRG